MFSKIKAFFVGVEHDIEDIISTFTSTVTKLEAAAEAKARDARTFAEQSLHYDTLASVAQEAEQRARDVAAKIKGLVAKPASNRQEKTNYIS